MSPLSLIKSNIRNHDDHNPALGRQGARIAQRAAGPNKIFFETANIKVTDTRFETGVETFPIRKISGVRIDTEKRRTRTGIAFILAGVVALLGGMLGNFGVLIMSGAALTVGGAMLCFARVNCTVVLTMRGADVKALTSKDAALILSIVSALQEAIANRG